jgi:hypothetical protein
LLQDGIVDSWEFSRELVKEYGFIDSYAYNMQQQSSMTIVIQMEKKLLEVQASNFLIYT